MDGWTDRDGSLGGGKELPRRDWGPLLGSPTPRVLWEGGAPTRGRWGETEAQFGEHGGMLVLGTERRWPPARARRGDWLPPRAWSEAGAEAGHAATPVPGAAPSCDSAAAGNSGTAAASSRQSTGRRAQIEEGGNSPPAGGAGRDVARSSSVPVARWPLIRPQSPSWQPAPVRHGTEGFPNPPCPPPTGRLHVPCGTRGTWCPWGKRGERGGAQGWHHTGQDQTLPS